MFNFVKDNQAELKLKKRISQRDIAKILGVNVSTVSRALKGLGGVGAELRKKIERLAEEKSYHPNPFAMSLRYDTTQTIGIVVPDMAFNFFAHIDKQVEAEARKKGLMCIVTDSGDTYEGEADCLERLVNLHVRGVILCLSQETLNFEHFELLKKHHIPLVLFNRVADVDFTTISINDASLAHQATLYLIDSGCRRIAFLGGPNELKQTIDRKHGYLQALRDRQMPICKELVKCGFVSYNSGLTDTLELLNQPEPPDAILAAHALLATSCIQTVQSRGIRVPDDVSIIGFMSDWVSDLATPHMSFIRQNVKEIGKKVFKALYDQINGDDTVRHIVVNARLDIRESTRKIPQDQGK